MVRSMLLGLLAASVSGEGTGHHGTDEPRIPLTTAALNCTSKVKDENALGGVFVYQNCQYGGLRANLIVGDYTTDQLYKNDAWNNEISSLQVPYGCQVEVFSEDQFKGDSRIFQFDDDCLVDDGWNDMVSSLKVTHAFNKKPTLSPTKKPTKQTPEACEGGTGTVDGIYASKTCDYLDTGEKNCNGQCDQAIKFSYWTGHGETCQQECNLLQNCTGYSASTSNNCMLWHEPIHGLGEYWGGAHCMTKQCLGVTTKKPSPTCPPTHRPTLSPTGPTHHPTRYPTKKPVKHVNTGSYKMLEIYVSWQDAQNHCRALGKGWDLASVLNDKELVELRALLGDQKCWIGLNDIMTNKQWQWSDGSAYKYKHWNPGEPNDNNNEEHCVEMTGEVDEKTGGWNDLRCSQVQDACCGYRSASANNINRNTGKGLRAGVVALIVIGAIIVACVLGRYILFEDKTDHMRYTAQDDLNSGLNSGSHLHDSKL